ncbi:MAG TPA: helix-turn-helix domain-containing protein [Aggregatilineales bacterium]|nr:helix-turn-helix domain-containing protein [Aggregatilineales bacterium]
MTADATLGSDMQPVSDNVRADRFSLANTFAAVVNLPAAVWLALSGTGIAAIFLGAFASRYSLAKYGATPQATVASINNLSAEGAFLYVAGFALLFGAYWLGLRRGLHPSSRLVWLLIAAFSVIFNVILLAMYPVDAADIYDNIIRGRIAAIYGLNPMAVTPSHMSDDPFYPFAVWNTTTSAYGPLWEQMAAFSSRIAGDDPTANVIVFKALSILGYAITTILIWLSLKRIAPRRAITGVYLFAWNPLVLFMTAGVGHNDSVMIAFMALSAYCLLRRWYVASTLAALLGALVKFIPVLMIPIIAVIALRELRVSTRLRYLALSAVIGGALVVALYAPYWHGLDTLALDRRAGMYTGSVATLARQTLGYVFDGHTGESADTPNTNNVLKYVVLVLLAVFYLDRLRYVWQTPSRADKLLGVRATMQVILFYLLVSCIWFQSWYALWVVGLAALLDNTPMQRFVLLFSYLVTWQTFLYNFVTLRPEGWAAIPWRDLIPIATVMGVAWAYIVAYWVSTWLRAVLRSPFAVRLGERLHAAREALQLDSSDLADELGWRTDDLLDYERGYQSPSVDRARALSQRLGVDLSQVLSESLP